MSVSLAVCLDVSLSVCLSVCLCAVCVFVCPMSIERERERERPRGRDSSCGFFILFTVLEVILGGKTWSGDRFGQVKSPSGGRRA